MILLFWVLCGIAAAMVASQKGKNGCGWFLLGFLLGPFGLIFALISGKEAPAENERKCPYCAEFIKKEAVVCKHCGRDLPSENSIDNIIQTHPDNKKEEMYTLIFKGVPPGVDDLVAHHWTKAIRFCESKKYRLASEQFRYALNALPKSSEHAKTLNNIIERIS